MRMVGNLWPFKILGIINACAHVVVPANPSEHMVMKYHHGAFAHRRAIPLTARHTTHRPKLIGAAIITNPACAHIVQHKYDKTKNASR